MGTPVRSKRSETGSEWDEDGFIQETDGSSAGTLGKYRLRMYSGVPSSGSGLPFVILCSGLSALDSSGERGRDRFRGSPFSLKVPRDKTDGSRVSGGGGRAKAFRLGDTGADSYTWTSSGVTGAKRSLRLALSLFGVGGLVLETRIGGAKIEVSR